MKKLSDFISLCKPKVVLVMLATTWVGMALATQDQMPLQTFIIGTLGIAFSAGAAAVINHLVDRHIDAKMQRTRLRPIASGRISTLHALIFAFVLGLIGMLLLSFYVNILTAALTFLTIFGYAILYTLCLKHKTP